MPKAKFRLRVELHNEMLFPFNRCGANREKCDPSEKTKRAALLPLV